jgi:predicted dehydrogenase
MADTIKWGVIGSSGIARRRTIPEGIVPAPNAELVGVYCRTPETNAEVAAEFGAQAAGSVDELLAMDLDAVYVASPVDAHLDQVQACAQAGKHVLCEKPLGLNPEEAEIMIATCDVAKVQLGTGLMMRFFAQHQAALKLIRDGAIGKPTYARAQLSCWYGPIPGAWRQDPAQGGGGALMDLAGHCIDLLEMFFGPVETIGCFTNRTVHDYASEDSGVMMLKFANGALGTVDTLFCVTDGSSKNALELYGTQGGILATGTIGQGEAGEMTAYLEDADQHYNAQQTRTESGGIPITPDPVNMYRAEVEAFSQALLDGTTPPIDGAAGLRSQRILAACYQSAETGAVVGV